MSKANVANDPRIDPRIKAFLSGLPAARMRDFSNRDELLAAQATPEAKAQPALMQEFSDLCDSEEVASSERLIIETLECVSQPDENTVKIQFIRPDIDEVLPCLRVLHPRRWHDEFVLL